MSSPKKQAVTIGVEGASPFEFLAAYNFVRQLGRTHGLSEVRDCVFRLEVTLFCFASNDTNASGLQRELTELGIDAQVIDIA
jgi:hypothetical protein